LAEKNYRVLVLLAHPSLQHSRINRTLANAVRNIDGVMLHDLYDAYPEFYINVNREQQLLLEHDLFVFQHPLYWYSTTPMLKLWQDVVLTNGFAYGESGNALHNKDFLQVTSTGGKAEAFQNSGYNKFTLEELLVPMRATCNMCGMTHHSPLVLHHSFKVTDLEIEQHANHYKQLLQAYVKHGASALKNGDQ